MTDTPDTPPEPTDAADTGRPAPAPMTPAECATQLAQRFPALFTPGQPRPLKLRIQADIQARAPEVFTRKVLSAFLHRHTTGNAYLKSMVAATHRIDLDGQPAGELSDEHRQAAVTELERRRDLAQARRQAEREAARAAERGARDAERQSRAAEDDAARQRLALLRAWETTTLTPANFLALKGLSQAELDAALAQAREDRERRPPPLRQEHRPPANDDRRRAPAQRPAGPRRR